MPNKPKALQLRSLADAARLRRGRRTGVFGSGHRRHVHRL
jgi:hypothetical protein